MTCEAIPGESFRFICWSKEDRSDTKMVDLIHGCSCRDWVCRHAAYEKMTGHWYTCKHQKAAWEQVHDGIRKRYRKS